MYERHENEQYFYDEATLDHLAGFVSEWNSPCCICAPMLGRRLAELGCSVTILDIDERFATTPGFRKYDIYQPEWLGTEFDLIVCDPPFFNASLSQLFTAMRTLSRNDFNQPILISYLARRSNAILGTFSKYGLVSTNYFPGYQTVQDVERNRIEFFGNLPADKISMLNGGTDSQNENNTPSAGNS